MLNTTVSRLRCPQTDSDRDICGGLLTLHSKKVRTLSGDGVLQDTTSGELRCQSCQARYPIIAGVAILVESPGTYILDHVKGIAQVVPVERQEQEIPIEYLEDFIEAREQIETEHIEEDLEAERVVSLYLMNHYLRVKSAGAEAWWKPRQAEASPLIDQLVREHWDHGPLARIRDWVESLSRKGETLDSVVELGCGVGGLSRMISPWIGEYLGVDSSFASIALARHLVLGTDYDKQIRIPEDLLQGPVSRPAEVPVMRDPAEKPQGRMDFVVGDLMSFPVERHGWDLSIVLNAIDMLPEPSMLPALQKELARSRGIAIQSCPYIWHEEVARELRAVLPPEIKDSAAAVEWLYDQAGFRIEERVKHLPWLFFKHVRQLEIYSVHMFVSRLADQ